MFPRVAKVRTAETGWRLVTLLEAACPFNKFALVQRAPTEGFEIVPTGPLHPIDKTAAQQTVVDFVRSVS